MSFLQNDLVMLTKKLANATENAELYIKKNLVLAAMAGEFHWSTIYETLFKRSKTNREGIFPTACLLLDL